MKTATRQECDDLLLESHVEIKELAEDMAALLRCNDFDPVTRAEVVFMVEKTQAMVESSLLRYQRFRP